jgi:hypothetical protein
MLPLKHKPSFIFDIHMKSNAIVLILLDFAIPWYSYVHCITRYMIALYTRTRYLLITNFLLRFIPIDYNITNENRNDTFWHLICNTWWAGGASAWPYYRVGEPVEASEINPSLTSIFILVIKFALEWLCGLSPLRNLILSVEPPQDVCIHPSVEQLNNTQYDVYLS